jgi:4-amino-4-deoxy-L-arabinose transferase-like glycosyltransferase
MAARPRDWRLALLFVALAGWLVLLTLLLAHPPATTIDLGQPGDTRYSDGFFPPEGDGNTTFRWSGPEALLRLHGAGARPLLLDLRIHSHPELAASDTRLRIQHDTQDDSRVLASFALHAQPGWHVYRVLLPAEAVAGADLRALPLTLAASSYTPGEHDRRDLGVPIDWLRITPLPDAPPRLLPLLGRALLLSWGLALLAGGLWWLRASWLPRASPWLLIGLPLAGAALALLVWAAHNPYALAWALPSVGWLPGLLTLLLLVLLLPQQARAGWPLAGVALLFAAQLALYTQWAVAAGVALAVGGILLLALRRDPQPALPDLLTRRQAWLGLALCFGLALALRLYQLDSLPYGLWRDEARHGLLALRMLDDPTYRPIYEPAGGVDLPGLGFYPFALALHLFGIHVWTLRAVTALAGALTVLPLYALAWALWQRRDLALLAAGLLAVSSWHLTISRFAFPTIFDPLLSLTALWLLLCALKRSAGDTRAGGPRRLLPPLALSLLAGAALGLAAQTYHTGRLVPLLAVLLALAWLAAHRQQWRHWLLCVGGAALGLALTVAPLVGYALRHPETFNDRVGDVALLSTESLHARAPLAVFDGALGQHALMFNAEGDSNGRHHAPQQPMLGFISGLGLLAGGALLLRWRDWRSLFVLAALALTLAPSLLAVNGPHGMRAIGALAFACLIAALGWLEIAARLARLAARAARPLTVGGLALVLAAALLINSRVYFGLMPQDTRVWTSFYPIHTQMGIYVRELAAREGAAAVEQIYVPRKLSRNAVFAYMAYGLPFQTFDAEQSLSQPVQPGARFLLSGYTYRDDVRDLRAHLDPALEPTARGPLLPGRDEPAFLVYRAREAALHQEPRQQP